MIGDNKKFHLSIYCGEAGPFNLARHSQEEYDKLLGLIRNGIEKEIVFEINTGHDTFPQSIILNGKRISAVTLGIKMQPKDSKKEIPV